MVRFVSAGACVVSQTIGVTVVGGAVAGGHCCDRGRQFATLPAATQPVLAVSIPEVFSMMKTFSMYTYCYDSYDNNIITVFSIAWRNKCNALVATKKSTYGKNKR